MVVLRAEMRTKMFCGGQLFQDQKWQWERRDMKRYEEIWRDMKRYEEIWRDMKRYEEIWRDMKRYEEIWRDMRKKRYEAAISLFPKRLKRFLTVSCTDMTCKTGQNSPRSVASWVPAGHVAAVTSNLSSTHMLETCSPWETWPLGAKKRCRGEGRLM